MVNDVSEPLPEGLMGLTVVGPLRAVERVANFILEMEELQRAHGSENRFRRAASHSREAVTEGFLPNLIA